MKVVDVCGSSIEDVAAIIEKLDLIIGPDSGLFTLSGSSRNKSIRAFWADESDDETEYI